MPKTIRLGTPVQDRRIRVKGVTAYNKVLKWPLGVGRNILEYS